MRAGCLVEVETCQLCGTAGAAEMFSDPPYRVLRCPDCGLVYVTPRHPGEELHKVYGEGYWNSDTPRTRGYACYTDEEALYLKTFRRRRRLLQRHVRAGSLKVLDVGCAAGFFLRVMQELGHDVRGIELSSDIASHAIRHLGKKNIHVGLIEDLGDADEGFTPHSFDVVTLWDVIEHLPDPQAMLTHVHRLLRPDGILVLETQNVDSRFANLLGRRWQHYKHEEHLYHFNPSTIRRLLEQAGFVVVSNTPAYGGKYVSLSFLAERAKRVSPLLGFLFKPLGLFKKANLYFNLNDEMIVVARPTTPRNGTS